MSLLRRCPSGALNHWQDLIDQLVVFVSGKSDQQQEQVNDRNDPDKQQSPEQIHYRL